MLKHVGQLYRWLDAFAVGRLMGLRKEIWAIATVSLDEWNRHQWCATVIDENHGAPAETQTMVHYLERSCPDLYKGAVKLQLFLDTRTYDEIGEMTSLVIVYLTADEELEIPDGVEPVS